MLVRQVWRGVRGLLADDWLRVLLMQNCCQVHPAGCVDAEWLGGNSASTEKECETDDTQKSNDKSHETGCF